MMAPVVAVVAGVAVGVAVAVTSELEVTLNRFEPVVLRLVWVSGGVVRPGLAVMVEVEVTVVPC